MECAFDDCDRTDIHSRGYCGRHYTYLHRKGLLKKWGMRAAGGTCSAAGCEQNAYARGMCEPHYRKARRIPRRVFHAFEVRGDHAAVFIRSIGVAHECLVDLDTLQWMRDLGRRWSLCDGYAHVGGSKPMRLHREVVGCPRGLEVDHINGNRTDNRRANLRVVTRLENRQNRPALAGGTSKFRGVCFSAQKKGRKSWLGQVSIPGVKRISARFETELECAWWAHRKRADFVPFSADARGVIDPELAAWAVKRGLLD